MLDDAQLWTGFPRGSLDVLRWRRQADDSPLFLVCGPKTQERTTRCQFLRSHRVVLTRNESRCAYREPRSCRCRIPVLIPQACLSPVPWSVEAVGVGGRGSSGARCRQWTAGRRRAGPAAASATPPMSCCRRGRHRKIAAQLGRLQTTARGMIRNFRASAPLILAESTARVHRVTAEVRGSGTHGRCQRAGHAHSLCPGAGPPSHRSSRRGPGRQRTVAFCRTSRAWTVVRRCRGLARSGATPTRPAAGVCDRVSVGRFSQEYEPSWRLVSGQKSAKNQASHFLPKSRFRGLASR